MARDFTFLKKPKFWVTTIIAIILTFAGGFILGNNQNCIIDSPYSIQSVNQQGGITAGSIAIESPNREINQDFINQLNQYLPISKNKTITITSVLGDAESFQFASKLKQYLESDGWNVNGVDQALYTEPIIGIAVKPDGQGNVEFIIGSKT